MPPPARPLLTPALLAALPLAAPAGGRRPAAPRAQRCWRPPRSCRQAGGQARRHGGQRAAHGGQTRNQPELLGTACCCDVASETCMHESLLPQALCCMVRPPLLEQQGVGLVALAVPPRQRHQNVACRRGQGGQASRMGRECGTAGGVSNATVPAFRAQTAGTCGRPSGGLLTALSHPSHTPLTVLARHLQSANCTPSWRPAPTTRCISAGALAPNLLRRLTSMGSPADSRLGGRSDKSQNGYCDVLLFGFAGCSAACKPGSAQRTHCNACPALPPAHPLA